MTILKRVFFVLVVVFCTMVVLMFYCFRDIPPVDSELSGLSEVERDRLYAECFSDFSDYDLKARRFFVQSMWDARESYVEFDEAGSIRLIKKYGDGWHVVDDPVSIRSRLFAPAWWFDVEDDCESNNCSDDKVGKAGTDGVLTPSAGDVPKIAAVTGKCGKVYAVKDGGKTFYRVGDGQVFCFWVTLAGQGDI